MSQTPPARFEDTVAFGRKQVRGRFVIPSGIRCTRASTIEWCFANVPSIGVITTKSISLAPRAGYREPIYARYAEDCYINAVGLSNPGAEQFRRELEAITVPRDKFLLVSIFGGDVEQFVRTAQVLAPVADGFELNMSCPHAKGYGVEIGQKCDLVAEITTAVFKATGLPVMVKLSAVMSEVNRTAKAAIDAGAAGITVSNTVGPATVNLGDKPILSNRVGGLSGMGIRPLALRSVSRIREAVGAGPTVIGMGGVATVDDLRQFYSAGADFIGIGSALTGMDSAKMVDYFAVLEEGMRGVAARPTPLPRISMEYHEARVVGRKEYHPGVFKLLLDRLPVTGEGGSLGGRYFFLFIPEVGEKPFAIFSAEEKSVVVRVAGAFTKHLAQLQPGATIYLRGPYGRPFPDVKERTVVMVGGGTGTASLLEIGHRLKDYNQLHFLLGGRTAPDLFDLEKFTALGSLSVATDDGSTGQKGYVSELLKPWIARTDVAPLYIFCGPEPMVEASFRLVAPKAPPEDIWASIEYMTSCGVGICGKCACPTGQLSCIDGPFLQYPAFQARKKTAAS